MSISLTYCWEREVERESCYESAVSLSVLCSTEQYQCTTWLTLCATWLYSRTTWHHTGHLIRGHRPRDARTLIWLVSEHITLCNKEHVITGELLPLVTVTLPFPPVRPFPVSLRPPRHGHCGAPGWGHAPHVRQVPQFWHNCVVSTHTHCTQLTRTQRHTHTHTRCVILSKCWAALSPIYGIIGVWRHSFLNTLSLSLSGWRALCVQLSNTAVCGRSLVSFFYIVLL